ncbi:BTB/POZ domain-containing protein KCTD6-like [Saccostrea cucullata]|uniref:BTB/POZ domain-containing protein KCTD6-like n=1 Tax=Saccostrea cuccullata TaxID=36930 RepID=UPI002ED2C4D5
MEKSEVILLNVGGYIYNTTRATLVKYPNSTLGLMMKEDTLFSKDQDGNFFIDRDGQMFRYILNFCRSGKLCLPQQFSDYDLLENEAKFYEIEPLVTSIKSSRKQAMKKYQGFNYIEVVEEKSYYFLHSTYVRTVTSLYGRTDDLKALPPDFVNFPENLLTDLGSNYSKLTINKCDVRLQIGEFLSERGWVKEHSDLQVSSSIEDTGYSNKKYKELTYRDVWKMYKKND